jgi:TRAP transporter TAXI family solute receptor
VLRAIEEFDRGRADASLGAMGMPKVREIAAQGAGIMFLTIPNTPAGVAAMQKIAPPAYLDEVKPSAAQPGIDQPVLVQAYDYVLLTRAGEPEEIVYKVVKAMHDNKADLVASVPGFREFGPDKMAKKSTVEYHPGAIKFYTEKGLWPPKQ